MNPLPMDNISKMRSLKEFYLKSHEKGEVLRGVIGNCQFAGLDEYETSIMIYMVAGCLPLPGESADSHIPFTDEEALMVEKLIREAFGDKND